MYILFYYLCWLLPSPFHPSSASTRATDLPPADLMRIWKGILGTENKSEEPNAKVNRDAKLIKCITLYHTWPIFCYVVVYQSCNALCYVYLCYAVRNTKGPANTHMPILQQLIDENVFMSWEDTICIYNRDAISREWQRRGLLFFRENIHCNSTAEKQKYTDNASSNSKLANDVHIDERHEWRGGWNCPSMCQDWCRCSGKLDLDKKDN